MSCLSSATRAFCQPSGRDCRVPLASVSGKRGARLGFQRDEQWTRQPSRCTIAAVCAVVGSPGDSRVRVDWMVRHGSQ
jgi:hypothetical protein